MLKFETIHTDPAQGAYLGSFARRGRLTLNHGVVETPIFMPVGTYGTVKGVMPASLHDMGAQIILGNTFHLWLRPGMDVIKQFGGLHGFETWDKPILTDSGGFQVWSLGDMRKISEEGVQFASPVNGDRLFLTPEISMEIQTALNSDIVMQFDECTPYLSVEKKTKGQITTEREARASMELSMRWAKRCQTAFEGLENPNALFGIVQGGMFESLRDESLAGLEALNFPGLAVGGLSVGEPKEDMLRILQHIGPKLPANKPHYLMGVGTPEDLIAGVLSTQAFADDSQNNIALHTDFMVQNAMTEVKQELALSVTYDVLTASHTFEPEIEEAETLVAEITITPIEPVNSDDNDA